MNATTLAILTFMTILLFSTVLTVLTVLTDRAILMADYIDVSLCTYDGDISCRSCCGRSHYLGYIYGSCVASSKKQTAT